jgi:hypothetical protein
MPIERIVNVSGKGVQRSVAEVEVMRRQYQQMLGGLLTGGGGGGGSSSGGSAGSTFVTPSALAALLGDIPIANDGDVVEPDYHNTLREALLALAAFLGQGLVTQAQVRTYGPALITYDVANGNSGQWSLRPDFARAENGWVAGWLPVDLPDGVQLRSLQVIANRTKDLQSMDVTLGCVSLSDSTATSIALAEVKATGGESTFTTDSASINPVGSNDPNLIASLGKVDNSTYRYFINAKIEGSEGVLATIYAFQITYTLP